MDIMFAKLLTILLVTIFLTNPFTARAQETTIDDYLSYFYNRHSRFLDTTYQPFLQSWHFDIPYYEPAKRWQASLVHPRYHLSLATFYKYRLAESPYVRKIIRQAILDSTLHNQKAIADQSFNDAIANFLVVRLAETHSRVSLLTDKERQAILSWLKPRLLYGLQAQDTENRAALAGVYWFYVGQYLYNNNLLTAEEFKQIHQLTKDKIDLSIKQTLNKNDYIYRESGKFSLHYHTVEAYMLLIYGELTREKSYIDLAQKMTTVINRLAEEDGSLWASLGHRPDGIGAQAYLMAGILNLYFEQIEQARKFLAYADGNRFFADPQNLNRLVWSNVPDPNSKSSLLPNAKIFNDDISFVNMAELALILSASKNIKKIEL